MHDLSFRFAPADNLTDKEAGAVDGSAARGQGQPGPNARPSGLDGSINFYEDAVLTLNDPVYFGYADADGDAFGGVWIDSTSGSGTFTLNGAPLTLPVFVTAAQVAAGDLRFTPEANVSGNNYAAFTFRVTDATGEIAAANTRSLNILPVNDAPTITGLDGDFATYTEDLQTSSRIDVGANAVIADLDSANFDTGLLRVAVTAGAVPTRDRIGIFQDSTVSVTAGNVVVNGVVIGSVSGVQIVGEPLVISFGPDATPDRVQLVLQRIFYSSGNQQDPVSGQRTITITLNDGDGASTAVVSSMIVVGINDAPTGTDLTRTINEDQAVALNISNFGFDDHGTSVLSEGQALQAVIITTLPTAGTLYFDTDGAGTGALGTPVTAGQLVNSADIPRLVYVPPANANGNGLASFTFQVQDNGGTANGGVDTDPTPNTLTYNVTAVNDAPVNIVPAAQTGTAGGALVFSSANANALVITDVDAGAGTVRVKVATDHGTLTLASTAGLTVSGNGTGLIKMTGTLANINAALNGLSLQGEPGYTGPATLVFTHNDLGRGGSGGQLIDKDRITINWQAASQEPLKSGDKFNLADLGPELAATSLLFDFAELAAAGLQRAMTERPTLDAAVQPELSVWHDLPGGGSDFLL